MQLKLLRALTLILFLWGVVDGVRITQLEHRVHSLEGQIDSQLRRSLYIQDKLEDMKTYETLTRGIALDVNSSLMSHRADDKRHK